MMKKVFLDTNILIDYLARRGQFFEPAAQIVQLGQQHEFDLLVSAMSFATASFILEAHHKLSNETIVRKFADFVAMCNVTPVDTLVVDESIASRFSDFEDAMQYYTALKAKADFIITRNGKDFAASKIPVMTATEFLAI